MLTAVADLLARNGYGLVVVLVVMSLPFCAVGSKEPSAFFAAQCLAKAGLLTMFLHAFGPAVIGAVVYTAVSVSRQPRW